MAACQRWLGRDRMIIRPATIAEAGQVASVYLASRKAFVAFAPMAHTEEDVRHWIADTLVPAGGVSVAVDDATHAVVGMMAVSTKDGVGWIDQLYLDPSAVGRGLGTRFVNQAKAELGSPIRLYCFQENEPARRFYERLGFRAIAFGDGSDNEERRPDILYEWIDNPG